MVTLYHLLLPWLLLLLPDREHIYDLEVTLMDSFSCRQAPSFQRTLNVCHYMFQTHMPRSWYAYIHILLMIHMFQWILRGTSTKNITLFFLQHNKQPEQYWQHQSLKSDPRRAEYKTLPRSKCSSIFGFCMCLSIYLSIYVWFNTVVPFQYLSFCLFSILFSGEKSGLRFFLILTIILGIIIFSSYKYQLFLDKRKLRKLSTPYLLIFPIKGKVTYIFKEIQV